mgnify:CR=1 FL=1
MICYVCGKRKGKLYGSDIYERTAGVKIDMSMALPMVLSMMVSSLYNIVDSFFIARISEDAMTALSLVYPVQNLVNAVMIGFGIGINAVISFYLGAQDKEMADRAATQGMLLGTIHGIGFMILGIVVMRPFLQMFTGNAQIVDYGVRYSRIAFLFATALSWQLVFEKTFQAVGRMVESMTCMMSGAIINIILDPVLIFGLGPFPKMGIEGAALATGIGQAAAALLYLILYIANPLPVKYRKKYLKVDLGLWKKLYVIGIPASLNLALPSLLISVLNVILTGYGKSMYSFSESIISCRPSCTFRQMESCRECVRFSDIITERESISVYIRSFGMA